MHMNIYQRNSLWASLSQELVKTKSQAKTRKETLNSIRTNERRGKTKSKI